MATNSARKLPNTSSEVMDAVQKTCRSLSGVTTTHMVELANDKDSQKALTTNIFPLYLYSWGLANPEAAIIYLLLHCFLLRRQTSDSELARKDFETRIEELKADLSAKTAELRVLQSLAESSEAAAAATSTKDEPSLEAGRLNEQLKELQSQVARLQVNNDELCHINQQWAIDYEALTQRSTPPSTGLQTTSSSVRSTSPLNCMECHSLRNQLEETRRELRASEFKMERMQSKMDRKDQELEHLESENKAIQMQLQEVGDLHSAVKAREELSTVQHQMVVLKKQYQDAVCQRLQYNKQVESLRQAFLQIFPFASSATRSGYAGERGYSTYPASTRPCRDQQFYSDPGPPTPPGLIARGDHHGSLVEKDVDPPPIVVRHSDEQVIGFPPLSQRGGGGGDGLVPGTIKTTPHSWHGTDSRQAAVNGIHREAQNGVGSAGAVSKMFQKEQGRREGNISPQNGGTLTAHNQGGVNPAELAKKLESSQANGQARWNAGTSHKLQPNYFSFPSGGSPANRGLASSHGHEELRCPTCSRAFSYDLYGFDDWFDHIKYCAT